MADVADVAHRCREVRRRHEEHPDALDFEDLIEVSPSLDVLDERDQQGFVVGTGQIVTDAKALATGVQTPLAERRELAAGNEVLGIGARVHMGHDDGLRAAIQGAVDQALLVPVDAHDGGHAPDVAGPGQVAEIGRIHPAVFAFEPDAVEVDRPEGVDIVRVRDTTDDEGGFAGFEFAADAIRA